jgi:hypothetical protein
MKMKRLSGVQLGRFCGATATVVLLLGVVAALTSATPTSAATYPSMSITHPDGIKVGETLKLTGKGFTPDTTVTVYQCNQGMLDSPNGIFNSSTCDLKNTVKTTSSSTGTVTVNFKVAVANVHGQPADEYAEHSGHGEDWCWQRPGSPLRDPTSPIAPPRPG